MVLGLFRRKNPNADIVEALYQRMASAARQPAFYRDLGVPDTVEGRFDMLVLHAFLVLRRIRTLPAPADELGQDLVDLTFRYFDTALRELGVGDISVPKRMKKLAEAFYGRVKAYDDAWSDDGRLTDALELNLFNRVVSVAGAPLAIVAYMREAAATLEQAGFDDFVAARIAFPTPERPQPTPENPR